MTELPKETSAKDFRSLAELLKEGNSDTFVLIVAFGNPSTLLKSVDMYNGHAYLVLRSLLHSVT